LDHMALKFREELVGKRFLAVKDSNKDRNIAEWEWRAGVVRAVLHGRTADKDLQVKLQPVALSLSLPPTSSPESGDGDNCAAAIARWFARVGQAG